MTALATRRSSFPLLAAVCVPVLLVWAWILLMRTEWASLLAPLLGPWAGIAYGHWECTLANQAQLWSWCATAALALAAPIAWRSRGWQRSALRRIAVLALALAVFQWFVIALLSVANTTC